MENKENTTKVEATQAKEENKYITQDELDKLIKTNQELTKKYEELKEFKKSVIEVKGTIEEPKEILTQKEQPQEEKVLNGEEQLEEYKQAAVDRRNKFMMMAKSGYDIRRNSENERLMLEGVILEILEQQPHLIPFFGKERYEALKNCDYAKALEMAVMDNKAIRNYALETFSPFSVDYGEGELFGNSRRILENRLKLSQSQQLKFAGL